MLFMLVNWAAWTPVLLEDGFYLAYMLLSYTIHCLAFMLCTVVNWAAWTPDCNLEMKGKNVIMWIIHVANSPAMLLSVSRVSALTEEK